MLFAWLGWWSGVLGLFVGLVVCTVAVLDALTPAVGDGDGTATAGTGGGGGGGGGGSRIRHTTRSVVHAVARTTRSSMRWAWQHLPYIRALWSVVRLAFRFRCVLWRGASFFRDDANAVEFSRLLSRSGPFYVKLGQWLAQRPDMLPPSFVRALQTLQHDAPTHSFEDTYSMLRSVHPDLETAFESFDATPISSASIAQVYRARVHMSTLQRIRAELDPKHVAWTRQQPGDGGGAGGGGGDDETTAPERSTLVAIKIRHPNVVESLRRDMLEFRTAVAIGRFFRNLFCLVIDVEAVAADMFDQCDLKREAEALAHMRNTLRHNHMVQLPVAFLATEQMIIESWMPGIFYTQIGTANDPNLRRYRNDDEIVLARDLCKRITMATYLQMLWSTGMVHGDFHHGNVLFELEYVGLGGGDNNDDDDGGVRGTEGTAARDGATTATGGTALRANVWHVSAVEGTGATTAEPEDDVFRSQSMVPKYPVRVRMNLVDFGIVLKLPPVIRRLVVEIFESVYRSDMDAIVKAFTELILLERRTSERTAAATRKSAPTAAAASSSTMLSPSSHLAASANTTSTSSSSSVLTDNDGRPLGTQWQWDRVGEGDEGDEETEDSGESGSSFSASSAPGLQMRGLSQTDGDTAFQFNVQAFYKDACLILNLIEEDRKQRKSGASAENVVRAILNTLYKHRMRIDGAVTRILINFLLIEEGYQSSRAYDNITENALMYVMYEDENGNFDPLMDVISRLWGGHFTTTVQGVRTSKLGQAFDTKDADAVTSMLGTNTVANKEYEQERELRRAARANVLSLPTAPVRSAGIGEENTTSAAAATTAASASTGGSTVARRRRAAGPSAPGGTGATEVVIKVAPVVSAT